MAEAFFSSLAAKNGLDAVAKSAGVAADAGQHASRGAVRAMDKYGIDLSGHVSRSVTPELIAWADEVYCMSKSHVSAIERLCPQVKARLLSEDGIADPFGGGEREYELAAREIMEAVGRIVKGLVDGDG